VYVNVHGGLTYSNFCHEPICHVAREGEPVAYWLGFDCGHFGDLAPGMVAFHEKYLTGGGKGLFGDDVYRDVLYVATEVEDLVDQLVGLTPDKVTDTSDERAKRHYCFNRMSQDRKAGVVSDWDPKRYEIYEQEYEMLRVKQLEAPKETA